MKREKEKKPNPEAVKAKRKTAKAMCYKVRVRSPGAELWTHTMWGSHWASSPSCCAPLPSFTVLLSPLFFRTPHRPIASSSKNRSSAPLVSCCVPEGMARSVSEVVIAFKFCWLLGLGVGLCLVRNRGLQKEELIYTFGAGEARRPQKGWVP